MLPSFNSKLGVLVLCGVFGLAAVSFPAASANSDAASTGPLLALSHLGPHLHAAGLSQLAAHVHSQPPAELTTSLTDGNLCIIKGYAPEWEGRLARQLLGLDLRHQILRIAAGSYQHQVMGLVKLEAGDRSHRRFDARVLQDDAVSALAAGFALDPQVQSLDLWAVIPANGTHDYDHVPVFSVSAEREQFYRALAEPRTAPNLLAMLGLVRLAPTYLRYAGIKAADNASAPLPATSYDAETMLERWEQRVAAAQARLGQGDRAQVSILSGINGPQARAALTIDDGPHPLTTPLMLAVLRDYGIHATFFLVAEKAEEYPELVRRIARDGHEIANHSYSHPRAHQVSGAQMLSEITACQEVIGRLTGTTTAHFRPPGGRIGEPGLQALAVSGHTLVMWSNNANDWIKPAPEIIAANALDGLQSGGIILMHQGSMESFKALPLILQGATARGLQLGTVSELLSAGAARLTRMTPQAASQHLRRLGYERE